MNKEKEVNVREGDVNDAATGDRRGGEEGE